MLRVTRQDKGYKRGLYDVLNCCSYALVILAYLRSSRGLVLFSVYRITKFRVGHSEKACSVLRVTRQRITNLCHVLKCCSYLNTVPQLKPKLNNAETKKPFHEFSFIKKSGGSFSENYY